jgi:hypothetical protein
MASSDRTNLFIINFQKRGLDHIRAVRPLPQLIEQVYKAAIDESVIFGERIRSILELSISKDMNTSHAIKRIKNLPTEGGQLMNEFSLNQFVRSRKQSSNTHPEPSESAALHQNAPSIPTD